jgi:1-acyl-sn-glycerol-3-phosphate acyltransferase
VRGGGVRFAARVALIIISLLLSLPLHLIFTAFGAPSPWPRLFLGAVARVCGALVTTQGTQLKSGVLYVSNHISWLDIPVLAGPTGAAFVAQAAIADWPLIGALSKLNRTVFVRRSDRMTVAGQVDTLRDALDHHQPVVIFPEGTTTDGQSLLPFKPSLFAVVTPAPRPMLVQPVFIDYGMIMREFAWIGDEGVGANAMRLLKRRGTFSVVVHFLEPIDPGIITNRKEITAESRKRIAGALTASLDGVAIV